MKRKELQNQVTKECEDFIAKIKVLENLYNETNEDDIEILFSIDVHVLNNWGFDNEEE